jgi:hypothetical protein
MRFRCDACGQTHTGATERQWRLPDPASLFPEDPPFPWLRICNRCRLKLVLQLGCGCAYCRVVAAWLDQAWEVTV